MAINMGSSTWASIKHDRCLVSCSYTRWNHAHMWKTSKGYFFSQCLVKSRLFTTTGRFLAGLFTILRWQPVVNRLRANGKNWFSTITMTVKKTSQSFLRCLSWHDHAELQNMVSPAYEWRARLFPEACLVGARLVYFGHWSAPMPQNLGQLCRWALLSHLIAEWLLLLPALNYGSCLSPLHFPAPF